MKFPQKWMNHWFLRSVAGMTGFRNSYDLRAGETFTPYFQYQIGDYQSDHYLYFKTQPTKGLYTGEVFQKMYEYQGYDLIRYIEFHYEAYEDKQDFLRWLRHETLREQRLMRSYRYFFWMRFPKFKARLQTTLAWVEEEEKRLNPGNEGVAVPGANGANTSGADGAYTPGNDGSAWVVDRIDKGVAEVLHAHSGKIVLYNQYHAVRLIQFLILLKDAQTGGKKQPVHLFKSFSDTDMAAVLRQFEIFGDKKTNTLQVKIGEAKAELDLNDPAVKKLNLALTEFFFSRP